MSEVVVSLPCLFAFMGPCLRNVLKAKPVRWSLTVWQIGFDFSVLPRLAATSVDIVKLVFKLLLGGM